MTEIKLYRNGWIMTEMFFYKKIYHSAAYTPNRMSSRRCNFIAKYKGVSKANFAYIKYFLNINSSLYVADIDLNIVSNITQNIKGRQSIIISDLKRKGFFHYYFFEVNFTNRFLLIRPEDIICKCLVYQLDNGNFQLSEFEIESDYN